MRLGKHATRTAVVLAVGVAMLWTFLADVGKDLDPAWRALEYDLHAFGAWGVAVLAVGAWRRRWPWAPWSSLAALALSGTLAVTSLDLIFVSLSIGHFLVALSLFPGVWEHLRKRGWVERLRLRDHWLRWTTALVALVAAVIANLSGALWAELDAETEWGPWAYVTLSWLTSALAACAWMRPPWRAWGLALGGVVSVAWFAIMLPYQFGLNLGGHFLAAVFFLTTAWEEGRRS